MKTNKWRIIKKAKVPYCNAVPVYPEPKLDFHKGSFKTLYIPRPQEEMRNFDYGMEGYRCEQVLKRKALMNNLYDQYSYLKWKQKGLSEYKKNKLLEAINEMLEPLEKEFYGTQDKH